MRSHKPFLSADTANLKAFLPHNPVIEIRRVKGRGRRCYKVLMWMPKDAGDARRGSLGFIDETVAFAQIADVEHENGEYLKLSTGDEDVFELLYQKVIKPLGLQHLEIRISEKGKFWKLVTPEETHSDPATELTEAQSEATKIEAVVPPGFSLGKDISFETMSDGRIAIDKVGTPIFFVGFLDQDKNLQYRTYDIGAAHAVRDWRKTKRFLALEHGSIHLSSFLPEDRPFKVVEDRFVKLPAGPHNEYEVVDRDSWEIDVKLTRQLFGATFEELSAFLRIFQSVVRRPLDPRLFVFQKRPRITFSGSRDNVCDLTMAYIPERFPYIAFADSGFFGGHISLHGFYRLLALICEYRIAGDKIRGKGIFGRLVEEGADPRLIVQFIKAAFASYSHPMLDPNYPGALELPGVLR